MAYKRCLITNNNPIQLLDKSKYPATTTKNGVTFTNNGDGTITVNGSVSSGSYTNISIINPLSITLNHKYCILGGNLEGGNNCFLRILGTSEVRDDRGNGSIFVNTFSPYECTLIIMSGYTASNLVFKPQLFDLTEMFGAGNEPTTVAEFRALYPDDLYPYNPTNCVTSYKKMMKVSDVCQILDKNKYNDTFTVNGVTLTNNRDGTITTSGTATGSGGRNAKIIEGIVLNPGKYCFYTYDSNVSKVIPCLSKSADMSLVVSGNTTFTISKTVEVHFGVNVNAGNTYSGYFIPQLFDLTEMYGAGNEPTTVAAFREKFPNEMYPYSPQCFVTAYKNNMVAKTKNLWTCDKPAPNNDYQYDSSTQTFKINSLCNYSCYTLPTPFPTGTAVSISVHFLSGVIKDGGTVAIGGYHKRDTRSWQCYINLPDIYYKGIDLTGRTFTSTYTTTDTLTDFWIFIYGTVPENMQFKVQLELGSTATDYVPYGYL